MHLQPNDIFNSVGLPGHDAIESQGRFVMKFGLVSSFMWERALDGEARSSDFQKVFFLPSKFPPSLPFPEAAPSEAK